MFVCGGRVEATNARAEARVREDKVREVRVRHDGTLVVHLVLVSVASK